MPPTLQSLKKVQEKQDPARMNQFIQKQLSKYRKKDNPLDESTDRTKAMQITDNGPMDPDLTGQGNSSLGQGIPDTDSTASYT